MIYALPDIAYWKTLKEAVLKSIENIIKDWYNRKVEKFVESIKVENAQELIVTGALSHLMTLLSLEANKDRYYIMRVNETAQRLELVDATVRLQGKLTEIQTVIVPQEAISSENKLLGIKSKLKKAGYENISFMSFEEFRTIASILARKLKDKKVLIQIEG
jgi:hypothetical protein